jgi:protein-disulfide isomerase
MRAYVPTALVSVATVVMVLGAFFAGFFVRGWMDQEREVTVSPPGGAAQPGAASTRVGERAVSGVSADDDPFWGPEDAAVTIIEFSDFQCAFCKRHFDETLPLLLDTYSDRVRYVFRDFPISTIHPQAFKAAEAAQCAFVQGKFWEYHDVLFQNQTALDVTSLKDHAAAVGLDSGAFDQCLESGGYNEEVQADLDDGSSYGVNGTPTFFINERQVVGAQPFSMFQQIIDEELAKSSTQ